MVAVPDEWNRMAVRSLPVPSSTNDGVHWVTRCQS